MHPIADDFSKIVIIGNTGSGKTTLGRTLAERLSLTQIEMDTLYWEKDWVPAGIEIFRQRLASRLSIEHRWVCDGNYSKVRDITWNQANTIVWLDYPMSLVFLRLWSRSIRRLLTREILWNENRETWRGLFFSKESLLLFSFQSHYKHRRIYPELLASQQYNHIKKFHFTKPDETQTWLEQLPSGIDNGGTR